MTHIWVHELATEAGPLMERLRAVLAQVESPAARQLLERARVEDHATPRMVLTGQFSGGKSTLIEALTDRAVQPLTGADYTTDEITEYQWTGAVVLVDTPGVKSGVRRHDELASRAIGDSDFLLFVLDIGLFDDALRDYLRHLAHVHRRFAQMIVVVTKAKKMAAQPGARRAAVQEALGTASFELPVVEVDSLFYLRSLDGGPRQEVLRRESNLDALRDAINRISEDRGQLAQLRRPFQLIRQICDQAQGLFFTDPSERLALSVLASQRTVVTERRAIIDTMLGGAESAFASRCLVDVTAFADQATSLPEGAAVELAAAERALVAALDRHASQFAEHVNRLADAQFTVLAEQMSEIASSNRAAELLRYSGAVVAETPSSIRPSARTGERGSRRSQGSAQWLQDVGEWLERGQLMWGAGDGIKASAGSWGHGVVKQVGHAFNVRFRPWQAVQIANSIGKAAKSASMVLQIGLAAHAVINDERAAHRAQIEAEQRHAALITEIMGQAELIASQARRQLGDIIDPPMRELLESIDELRDRVLGADAARDSHSAELTAIARAADRVLDLSAPARTIDGGPAPAP